MTPDPPQPADRAQQPRLDRRTLERLVIGAPARHVPPPSPPAPEPTPAGPPAAPAPAREPEPPPAVEPPPAPPSAARQPEPHRAGPLVLLLADDAARFSGRAAEAALDLAAEASGAAQAVLLDLDVERPGLHLPLGLPNDEGVADVLAFGTSLRRAAREVEGRPFRFMPAGQGAMDAAAVAAHPRWPAVLAEAERRGLLLLAFAPAHPAAAPLAAYASRAVLLAEPGEAAALRALLPPDLPAEVLAGPGPEPVERAAAPAAVIEASAPPRLLPEEEVEPEAEAGRAPEIGPEAAAAARLPRAALPRTAPGRERLVRAAAVPILAYWAYYIVWRWTGTLNPDALWFSVPLALAETWGLLTAGFLVFTAWKPARREPPPAPPGLAVDVLITAGDEPLEVIRRTTISALEIRYPHRTYLLDDGGREEVRAMAEGFGAGYITRADGGPARAGGLSGALGHTTGDFLLRLDAGHAPLPGILDRLLGYFDDPEVAFVQTPQDFQDAGSLSGDGDEEARRARKLFFTVVQPGKDHWNSALLCGSGAVLRRAALAEIGGPSTGTAAEDIETSLLVHARGWRSVYHAESLAYGLAAGPADALQAQHLRWARGGMQVLRSSNPLTLPGLTLAQRIGYFSSLTSVLRGPQRLVFYSAPLVFFLTGALPVRALDAAFLVRFVPYLLLALLLGKLVSRGVGSIWAAERQQMARFWTYTRAVPAYFTSRRSPSGEAPKGPHESRSSAYAPQLVLMVATVFAVNWATVAYEYGWVSYRVLGWRSLAFQLNFLWALINFALAAAVVRRSAGMQRQRQQHRFSDHFPIQVRPRDEEGRLLERIVALTGDLNSAGLSFRATGPLPVGSEVRASLPLDTGEVSVDGRVVYVREERSAGVPVFVHGVTLLDVPLDVRDAIELHCTHHAAPVGYLPHPGTSALLTRTRDWVRAARGAHRQRVHLPTRVRLGDAAADGGPPREDAAFLEEISRGGARLMLSEPVPPGTRVTFEVPGTDLCGEGRAVFSHALETPIGVRFAVGVRREPDTGPPDDSEE